MHVPIIFSFSTVLYSEVSVQETLVHHQSQRDV